MAAEREKVVVTADEVIGACRESACDNHVIIGVANHLNGRRVTDDGYGKLGKAPAKIGYGAIRVVVPAAQTRAV